MEILKSGKGRARFGGKKTVQTETASHGAALKPPRAAPKRAHKRWARDGNRFTGGFLHHARVNYIPGIDMRSMTMHLTGAVIHMAALSVRRIFAATATMRHNRTNSDH